MTRWKLCGAVAVVGVLTLAMAPAGVKTVTLICKPGWRGGAGGQYGGQEARADGQ